MAGAPAGNRITTVTINGDATDGSIVVYGVAANTLQASDF